MPWQPEQNAAKLRAPSLSSAGTTPGSNAAATEGTRGGSLAEWRRNGAGAQILADLGLGKLRVMGVPRRQVGLAGYGLEIVEYIDPAVGVR